MVSEHETNYFLKFHQNHLKYINNDTYEHEPDRLQQPDSEERDIESEPD